MFLVSFTILVIILFFNCAFAIKNIFLFCIQLELGLNNLKLHIRLQQPPATSNAGELSVSWNSESVLILWLLMCHIFFVL